MKNLLLIIIVIFTSCAYKIKEPIQSTSFIDSVTLDTTKIRFDGFYNLIEDTIIFRNGTKYYFPRSNTNNVRIFNKNKNLYFSSGKINEYSPLNCEFYQKENKRYNEYNIKYPKFTIKNDSIYTYHGILITVGAGQRIPVFCNFRGFVKTRDTITDWKIIPPYPKDFTKFVKKNNEELFKPHTLIFIKTNAVKCLEMDK